MTELATITIVLEGTFTSEEQELGEIYLRDLVDPLASKLYRQSVTIDIYLADGSLKIAMAIAGSLYLGIGAYGSFRSGLVQMGKDAQAIVSLIETDIKKNGFPEDRILSIKKQTEFTSKLARLMNRVEKLNSYDTKDKQKSREIELVIRNIQRLLQSATEEADRQLVLLAIEEVDEKGLIIRKDPDRPERPDRTNPLFYMRDDWDEILSERLKTNKGIKLIAPMSKEDRIETDSVFSIGHKRTPLALPKDEAEHGTLFSVNRSIDESSSENHPIVLTSDREQQRCSFCLQSGLNAGELYNRNSGTSRICAQCAKDAFLSIEGK